MKSLKLGSRTFKLTPQSSDLKSLSSYSYQRHQALKKVHKTILASWDCLTQKRNPEPYPTSITGGPVLTFYDAPASGFSSESFAWELTPSDKRALLEAAHALGIKLLKQTGIGGFAELDKTITDQFGRATVKFDLDSLYQDDKPKYRMSFEVKMQYAHFKLDTSSLFKSGEVFISLPDVVYITADRTHRCLGDGRVEDMNDYLALAPHNVHKYVVKAPTKDAADLRKRDRKTKVDELKRKIAELRKDLAEQQGEIEGIGTGED